jgi:DNA (cytosine-5)-methyltransferase 1
MDWGLTQAGFDHAWFCESDPYCRSILERRWPGVSVFEDVRTLSAPGRVDVLAGGFPCQDISAAGGRAGITGERSGLWAHFARLIRELRPRYVIVENVPRLLVDGMGRVLGDLADGGYDAEWDCLPAAAFSAPHLRARIFIVAYPRGGWRQGDDLQAGRNPSRSSGPTQLVADAERTGLQGVTGSGRAGEGRPSILPAGDDQGVRGRWKPEPNVGRVAHGVPHRVDRLRALGNGVVPQIAEFIGRRILDYEEGRVAA